MNQDDESVERRASPRKKTLKSAVIVYQDGNCVMDCSVIDLSEKHARLKPADPINCPDVFELRRQGDPVRRCQVTRKHGVEVVVQFLD